MGYKSNLGGERSRHEYLSGFDIGHYRIGDIWGGSFDSRKDKLACKFVHSNCGSRHGVVGRNRYGCKSY